MKSYGFTKRVLLLVLLVAPSLGYAATTEKWPSAIVIGSFGKGSSSYPTNVALARLVSKYAPANGVVREYAGGTPGLEALVRGEIDTWAIGQNDFYNAYYGSGFWKGKPQDIRLLIGTWFYGPLGFGVRPGEGIRTLKDLAGKKCMVKSFLPYQNDANERILRKAGVWEKIKAVEMASTGEIVPAMREKTVDCFEWSIAAPYTLEIKQSVGLDWISLTEEEAGAINGIPGLVPWTAPRWVLDMYGYPADKVLRSFGYAQGVAIRSDMPDYVAYGILKAVYGGNNLNEFRSLSKDLTDASAKLAVQDFWLPFHAGAVRFYKEKGVWTAEMEKRQKEFLAKRGFAK
jgi:TRAP transporter TAXI family solute receptor